MSRSGGHKIFQIYYNETTRRENDQGFTPLDNSANLRPDWSEYWPIRHYLFTNELDDDAYYGFLSPKFKQKTNLGAADVFEFLDSANQDIVIFSPFFDQSALTLNVFEQAKLSHRGIQACFIEAFKALGSTIDIKHMVMHSGNTVFCNYFAAKKHVWDLWLKYCEHIFWICEENNSEMADLLNSPVNHSGSYNPAKVFVIERIISYLILTMRQWTVKVYNPMLLPYTESPFSEYKRELCELDALKIAYCSTGFPEYIEAFGELRAGILKKVLDGYENPPDDGGANLA